MVAGKIRQPLCLAGIARGDVTSLVGQELFFFFFLGLCLLHEDSGTCGTSRTWGHYDSPMYQIFGILLGTTGWGLDACSTDCCFQQKGQKDREATKPEKNKHGYFWGWYCSPS